MKLHEKKPYTTPKNRLPEICFRRSIVNGYFIPASPAELLALQALHIELQPCTRPWELIRQVRSSVFVKFVEDPKPEDHSWTR
jgi:hypothetical protein